MIRPVLKEAVKNVKKRIEQENARKKKLEEQLQKLPADSKNNRKSINEKIANANRMIKSLADSLANVEQGVLGITDAGIRRDSQDSIPIVSVSRELISNALFASTGKTLVELEAAIDETGSPQSVLLTWCHCCFEVRAEAFGC